MGTDFIHLLVLLVFGHMLADYPLQGDFLAKAKNRHNPVPGVPWYWAMGAHTTIHAGFVFIITGSAALAVAELLIHWLVDDYKCAGWLSFDADQFIHLFCKAGWAAMATLMAYGVAA